jgi:16S rRNA (guanine966-N2)-methyltransferase
MRVVAGALRGRRIEAPPGNDTRPTTDKVREAVFNALGSLDLVRDATVADLYAGSGALGIEALSRGAAHVTFVERDRTALRTLRDNLRTLELDDVSTVVAGDALVMGRNLDVDVVLADPPYGFDRWADLLATTRAAFVVAESGREIDPIPGWAASRSRRYGRTWVTFLERADQGAVPPVEVAAEAGIDEAADVSIDAGIDVSIDGGAS